MKNQQNMVIKFDTILRSIDTCNKWNFIAKLSMCMIKKLLKKIDMKIFNGTVKRWERIKRKTTNIS